jgi:hypothetical protein
MTAATLVEPSLESIETRLREDLAQGDAMLSTAAPILRHLLVNEDRALFSDEVVARVRGMLVDLARQLLHAQAETARAADPGAFVAEREEALSERLASETALLAHVHALVIEGRLALQLQARRNADPVLGALLQDLAASSDNAVAGSAMAALAAQARFIHHHRRMLLPLSELPAEVLKVVLMAWRASSGESEDDKASAERALRDGFDESRGRFALIARLVIQMGTTAPRALDIDHAGLAIFTTALAMASRQPRDITVLSFSERQQARLAVALRAAGLRQPAVAAQFFYLHPDSELPDGFDRFSADRAADLLASASGDI